MKKNDNILICKSVIYYSQNDEDAFFEWLKKINCIDDISGTGNELYLHISSTDLHDKDLRELLALFYRYHVNMKQLARFLNEKNKDWFYGNNQKGYWFKSVFESSRNNK